MKSARVLLVDDEVVFTGNMKKLLENRGYRVEVAGSGDEALDRLEGQEFDVVVLDLKMPGMDGMETLREIKDGGYMTEVMILTGHGAIDSALEAVKSGAYDYLAKPCGVDELVAKIEAAFHQNAENRRDDLNEMIEKIVESPSAVYGLMRGRKRRFQDADD